MSVSNSARLTEIESNKLLQLHLLSLGFDPGPIDGFIGPATVSATRAFQRVQGLSVDGAITEELRSVVRGQVAARLEAAKKKTVTAEPSRQSSAPVAALPAASRPGSQSGGDSSGFYGPIGIVVVSGIGWALFSNRPSARLRRRIAGELANVSSPSEVEAVLHALSPAQVQWCRPERLACFSRLVQIATANGSISRDEGMKFKALQGQLQLSDGDIALPASQLAMAEQLWDVEHGQLPVVQDPPIVTRARELVHFSTNAKLLEERVIARRTVGGSRGVSIRIMRGVSYRVGAYRGTSVPIRGLTVVSEGTFCITNQRVVFSGSNKSFSLEPDKVLSIQLHSDGITISATTGPSRTVQFLGAPYINLVQAILNRALGSAGRTN